MAARNLTLLRGKLYFAEFLTGTQTPGALRFIGNVTELNVNTDAQELEHRSSTEGRNEKDYSTVLQTDRMLSITTDDMGHDNVGLHAMGVVETVTVASGSNVTSAISGAVQGGIYQLGQTPARPEGLRNLSSVVIASTGGSPTTFVLNTDYTIDTATGLLTIVEGGNIADETDLVATFDNGAYSFTRIKAGTTKKEGELRWISTNPDGPQRNYIFPWVKMGPAADLSLVNQQDWATLGFEGEVLKKDNVDPWIAYGAATPTS